MSNSSPPPPPSPLPFSLPLSLPLSLSLSQLKLQLPKVVLTEQSAPFKRLTGRRAQEVQCEPVAVQAGGEVRLTLCVALPAGCDWTKGAPSAWQVIPGASVRVSFTLCGCVSVLHSVWVCECPSLCVGVRVSFTLCGCVSVLHSVWVCECPSLCVGVRVSFTLCGCVSVLHSVWVCECPSLCASV